MNNLQKTILEIFLQVRNICDKEGLRYFAIGGTAIGTVRHKGFIPWDDDLDIAMPIDDYIRFIQLAPRVLKDPYELVLPEQINEYTMMFGKICNHNATLIEKSVSDLPDRYTGIWIDIMPMSGVPTKHWHQLMFINRLALLRNMNNKRRWPYSKYQTIRGKALYIATAPLRALTKYDFASRKYLSLLNDNSFDEAKFTGYTWSDKLKDLIFPKEWFSDYILMPFENTQMRMPIGYNEYLTQQFGDYMTVPPPEQQITHRVFADLEHSYKDYQSGKLQIPEGYFDSEE